MTGRFYLSLFNQRLSRYAIPVAVNAPVVVNSAEVPDFESCQAYLSIIGFLSIQGMTVFMNAVTCACVYLVGDAVLEEVV